ncbi:tetratricopeptide repeat protein [Seohaeicola nanhaiensis]|uniref:Tetratricopeptide repeat protein n=1 Tax=Seohaeicola nanhaiensis TaxID=1387282 RepID=A0ABV9KDM0_9RHOB
MKFYAMINRGSRRTAVAGALVALMAVSACDSSEDRANKHFQSAMELLEKGDVDRAVIEFRNVFKLNANHHDARLAYAKMQRDRGFTQEAFAQYRKLAEQTPDDIDVLTALAELSLDTGNWEEFERQVPRLMAVAPNSAVAQSLDNSLQYQNAVRDRDDAARGAQVIRARELMASDPSLKYPVRVVIDDLLREQKWSEAAEQIDVALKTSPDDLNMLQLKLGVLKQLNDDAGMRSLLESMVERFPDNEMIRNALIGLYVENGDIDGADVLLKADAEKSTSVEPTRRYVAFLYQYRGIDAAEAELNRIIAEGRLDSVPFKSALGRLKFDKGEEDAAVAMLEEVSNTAERTAEVRNLETELAQMLYRRGNAVGARQLVERILQEDPSHPGASKLKAAWLIQDDKTSDAIVLLRDTLAKAPSDPSIMTLLAEAYRREGSQELAMEMLSQAVEASGKAPAESIRYAQALIAKEQDRPAEQVLIDALRVDPKNTDLLAALGTLYTKNKNWPQAEGVVRRLKEFDTPASNTVASGLEAQLLSGQQRNDELMTMLEGLADKKDTQRGARDAIFRTRLETNGPEDALAYVDEQLAENPGDPNLRFMRAGTLLLLDRRDESIQIFRELLKEHPESDRVWITLYRIERATGDRQSALAVLDEALGKLPENPALLLSKAEELQLDGKFEDAIKLYEDLYKKNSGSSVVANNLASLLADHRTDAESLQRAYAVARRLRGTDVPAFQDTYGWIAHRLGNTEEALPYLEGAAKGLPNDVTVQYHYAVSLAANGKDAEALEQFKKTETMIDAAQPPAFADEVKSEIARLSGATPAAPKP